MTLPNYIHRRLSVAWVLVLILLSWYYMLFGMTMNMQPVARWTGGDIALLFMMWAIMMAGMMLPSALPVIMLVEQINHKREMRQARFTPTLFFVVGYLLVWTVYSLAITWLQVRLHHLALLNPMMVSANPLFSASLLIAAGIYQFTPLKQTCLQLCRSPLSLLSSQWREGVLGAIRLGVKHGQYCVGCCWFLMALLFVTGVMNLQWILILTMVVLVEKCFLNSPLSSKLLGALLIALGIFVSTPIIKQSLLHTDLNAQATQTRSHAQLTSEKVPGYLPHKRLDKAWSTSSLQGG